MDAVIECRDEDTGVVFRWHGGAYIDVGSFGDAGAAGIDGDDFHAYDVINVWNYGGSNGRPEVSDLELAAENAPRPFRFILEAFESACEHYLEEVETDA